MKTLAQKLMALAGAFLALANAAACRARESVERNETAQIAEEAFVYGFPMVMGYGVMYEYAIDRKSDQYKAPFNQIYNTARVYTPRDTTVITPNSDTPYSFVWADLRVEPLLVTVPAIEKERYYSVQLTDMYTFNYGYIGSRTTGNDAGSYLVCGPHWSGAPPAGVKKVFRCETDFSIILFRTQLFGPNDLDNVKKVQAGYKVQTRSTFLHQPAPAPAPQVKWLKFDKELAQVDPFVYLNFVLQFCPLVGAAEAEEPLRQRFAKIGVEAGKPFSLDKLTAHEKARLVAGVKVGFNKIKQRFASLGKEENGWRLGAAAGDRAFFHDDWLLRAVGAMAGIYGNSEREAFYPFLATDSDGNKPDCRRNRYQMTFPAGQLPPVNAFWSVTMYDAGSQLLVENPINRYLINSPMLAAMKKNEDGSLTINIQKDSPGKDKESNWLPATDGPIYVVMRLYWPKAEALDGAWKPPPVVWVGPARTPAGVKRFGDKALEDIFRTDERYGHDGLFQGPRGWSYWSNLERPRPIQHPNLWPDTQSTYFLTRFAMPAGSTLVLHARYPYARYHKFALYKAERNTFISINEALVAQEIEPDPGSTNPFLVGANRLAEPRNFTLRIVAQDAPTQPKARARNTLYAGRGGGQLEAVLRVYLADQDRDSAGWGLASAPLAGSGLPTYAATLADGTSLSAEQVVKQFARPFAGETQQPVSTLQWEQLLHAKDNDPTLNPATAPARNPPRWEKFWNLSYSVVGAFKAPTERAKISFLGSMEGGGDPTTQYMLLYLSRKFGSVYVMRGKMPTFPNTYAGQNGKGLAVMPEAQTQYWSLVSCEAAPSGQVVDGLTDFQVPLDADRNFTIVVSRAEDRPKNATVENGVAWLNWGDCGEGLDSPNNRRDFGMLMLRIMANNPHWENSPDMIKEPGMEEAVMGPYYPRGYYTTKEQFEGERVKK
jgi:hypothetical protein